MSWWYVAQIGYCGRLIVGVGRSRWVIGVGHRGRPAIVWIMACQRVGPGEWDAAPSTGLSDPSRPVFHVRYNTLLRLVGNPTSKSRTTLSADSRSCRSYS